MRARLVLLLTAVILPALLFGQTSDVTPPVLVEFDFTPTTVDVSAGPQTITFTAKATDDLSGVCCAAFNLHGPSGQLVTGGMTPTGGTAMERTFQGTIQLPRYSQPGSWGISLGVWDNVGNQNFLSPEALAGLGFQNTLTVLSDPADLTAPTLDDVEVIPGAIDVSLGGQTVTVRYRVKDDLAGAYFLPPSGFNLPTYWGIYVSSPSGRQSQFAWANAMSLVSGDANDGWWEGSLMIPRHSEAGTWSLTIVGLHDLAANRRFYGRAQLAAMFGSKVQFTVASTPTDTIAPTLLSIDYTPKFINTSAASEFVTIRIAASDDLSGLLFGPTTPIASFFESGLEFRSPSGQQYRGICCWGPMTVVSGDAMDGTWEGQVFFPQFSEEGTWKVLQVNIKDAVRNFSRFTTVQLEAMMQPVDLVVIKPTGEVDGAIPGSAGGEVEDEIFGERAKVVVPPGVFTGETFVSIDVFPDPIGVPTPEGFQAEGTLFVNIEFVPEPSYPLPPPGLTVVLPLPSARIPGSSMHLFRVDPATATLVPAIGVDGEPVIGTVDGPDGLSATFTGIASLSTIIGLVPNVVPVEIDIIPGSEKNPINLKSNGAIQVALLGSASFSVRTVNPDKLWFGPGNAQPVKILMQSLKSADRLIDVNGDGYEDLLMHFQQRDTGIQAGATSACLYGETVDAVPVSGCDAVTTVP